MSRLAQISGAERLFIDTDFLLKFAASDLWTVFVAAFSLDIAKIRITTEPNSLLTHQSANFRSQLSPDGYRKAVSTIKSLPLLENLSAQERAEYSLLLNFIDPGEAALIAASGSANSFFLISADKNWPFNLWNEDDDRLDTIRLRLRQRCLCFEQILLFLVENDDKILDYAILLQRLYAIDDCWNSVGKYFRAGLNTMKADAIQELRNEIGRLRNGCGVLLMPDLPRI